MRLTWRTGLQLAAAGSAITLITMIGSVPVSASSGGHHPGPAGLLPALRGQHHGINADGGGESDKILASAQQYAAVRTAPGTKVSPAAFAAATAAAGKLAQSGGRWQATNQPYNSDALGYRDPTWSNSSGGARLVAGRMTALTVADKTLYAGAAAGGVWKSTDRGAHWTQVFGQQNNLSIGALATDP